MVTLIIEVLIGAAIIYVIAGFIVSFKRLLPFLAVGTSIVTIIVISNMQKNGYDSTMLFLPIVLSLLTQLFYQGEGYMNPKIHENIYTLVKIERKWEALLEENDSYVFHFRAYETGGFVENTVLLGILFGIYYGASFTTFEGSGVAYILSIYTLLMSILDILYIFGVRMGGISSFFSHGLVVIMSIGISLIGFGEGPNKYTFDVTEKLKKQCIETTEYDYSKSYKIEYNREAKYSDGIDTELNFIYDASLDVGAYYSKIHDLNEIEIVYDTVFTKEPRFNNKLARFENHHNSEYNFVFNGYATVIGGPFKYESLNLKHEQYAEPTMEKFNKSFYTKYTENGILNVSYTHSEDDDWIYRVIYTYNIDKRGNVTSLVSISCEIFGDYYTSTLIYTPIAGDTGLSELFTSENKLKGYTYNSEAGTLDTTNGFGIDFMADLNSVSNYSMLYRSSDFTMREIYDGTTTTYVYDERTDDTAIFVNNSSNSQYAIDNNDFETYKPNYFANFSANLYDATTGEHLESCTSEGDYTCNNPTALYVTQYMLYEFRINEVEIFERNGEVIASFMSEYDFEYKESEFIYYNFYYRYLEDIDTYRLYKIESETNVYDANYFYTIYLTDNVFDINFEPNY